MSMKKRETLSSTKRKKEREESLSLYLSHAKERERSPSLPPPPSPTPRAPLERERGTLSPRPLLSLSKGALEREGPERVDPLSPSALEKGAPPLSRALGALERGWTLSLQDREGGPLSPGRPGKRGPPLCPGRLAP